MSAGLKSKGASQAMTFGMAAFPPVVMADFVAPGSMARIRILSALRLSAMAGASAVAASFVCA